MNRCKLHTSDEHASDTYPDGTWCCPYCGQPTKRKVVYMDNHYHKECQRMDWMLYREVNWKNWPWKYSAILDRLVRK